MLAFQGKNSVLSESQELRSVCLLDVEINFEFNLVQIFDLVCNCRPIHNLQITNTVSTPEIAFTGDTMSDFILDPDNADVLKAKILVVEVWLISYYFATNMLLLHSSASETVFALFGSLVTYD